MSPRTTISQNLGLTKIVLDYSRPSLHGRIGFGENGVVPFEHKWRTGANGATYIESDGDIKIEGESLPKGKYAILTTPSVDQWVVDFYRYDKSNWLDYPDKTPEISVTVDAVMMNNNRETLLLYFDHINMYSSALVIEWALHQISLNITADAHEKVLADIDRKLKGPSNFDYYFAALYLHETQTDLPKALEYIQEVTRDEAAFFFQVYREALILKDLDRGSEALTSANRAKQLSIEAKNDDFVRLVEKLIDSLESD